MQRENINRENYDFFFSNDKVYEYCLFCLLITTFFEKKTTFFQYITASTNINFCTYKFLFRSENWVRTRREKNTRKKDIYVVIYAKHKIFVDKMFNIFLRHS